MQDVATPLATRYGDELAVMQEMSWSWRDLQDAPADLVEEIRVRRAARLHWEAERAKLEKARASQQAAARQAVGRRKR